MGRSDANHYYILFGVGSSLIGQIFRPGKILPAKKPGTSPAFVVKKGSFLLVYDQNDLRLSVSE